MSAEKYSKHQKSRKSKWVATLPDGTELSANNEKDLRKKISQDPSIIKAKQEAAIAKKNAESVELLVPKYDPFTGEPLE